MHIVFLTTYPVEDGKTFNGDLGTALQERGVTVSYRCWRNTNLSLAALGAFTHATVLSAMDYNMYIDDFVAFLDDRLEPAVQQFGLCVINSIDVVRWNSNKIYLQDLLREGLPVLPTKFVKPAGRVEVVTAALAAESKGPIVVKPSIAASGIQTHKIANPHVLDDADLAFLIDAKDQPASGYLMLQEFMPEISNGEYSLYCINGRIVSAGIKSPAAGEWRINSEHGGKIDFMKPDKVPSSALAIAERIWCYLTRKFRLQTEAGPHGNWSSCGAVYARIDGVMSAAGEFVLMEIELIEPSFAMSRDGHGLRVKNALSDAFLALNKQEGSTNGSRTDD